MEIGQPILYAVRHALNDDDAQEKLRGLRDQPLNSEGEKQLDALRAFFVNRPIVSLYTDDLSRTRATAMAVAQACGCEVETDIDLRSWDVGKLEGKSIAAHKLEIQDFKTHPDKVPVGGESWSMFEEKASGAIERAVRRGMEASGPCCIVTHGSLIQVLFDRYGDFDIGSQYDNTPLGACGVAALYLTRNGTELKILRGAKGNADA